MTATSVLGVEGNNKTLLRKPKVKTLLALLVPTATQNTGGEVLLQRRMVVRGLWEKVFVH